MKTWNLLIFLLCSQIEEYDNFPVEDVRADPRILAAILGYSKEDIPFMNEVVSAHNKYRNIHGSPPVSQCARLRQQAGGYAQKLAGQGAREPQDDPRLEFGVGENIYISCGNDVSPADVVDHWYNEACNYFGNKKSFNDYKHFAQVVWKPTYLMGVGRRITESAGQKCTYVVAKYRPKAKEGPTESANILRGSFDPSICSGSGANTQASTPLSVNNGSLAGQHATTNNVKPAEGSPADETTGQASQPSQPQSLPAGSLPIQSSGEVQPATGGNVIEPESNQPARLPEQSPGYPTPEPSGALSNGGGVVGQTGMLGTSAPTSVPGTGDLERAKDPENAHISPMVEEVDSPGSSENNEGEQVPTTSTPPNPSSNTTQTESLETSGGASRLPESTNTEETLAPTSSPDQQVDATKAAEEVKPAQSNPVELSKPVGPVYSNNPEKSAQSSGGPSCESGKQCPPCICPKERGDEDGSRTPSNQGQSEQQSSQGAPTPPQNEPESTSEATSNGNPPAGQGSPEKSSESSSPSAGGTPGLTSSQPAATGPSGVKGGTGGSEGSPDISEQTPSGSEQTPSGSEQTPGGSEQTPSGSEQAPSGPEQTPSGSQQTPSGSEQAPSGPEQTPSGSQQTPSGSEQAPSGPEQTPSGSEQTPSGPEQTPSASEQAPSGPEQTPSGSEQAPSDSEQTPSGSEQNTGTSEVSPIVTSAQTQPENVGTPDVAGGPERNNAQGGQVEATQGNSGQGNEESIGKTTGGAFTENLNAFQQSALKAHNKYRQYHNSPSLKFNSEMSAQATEYAKKLSDLGLNNTEHSPMSSRPDQGENIYAACGTDPSGADVTKEWYKELCNYDYNKHERIHEKKPIGHFTQVVWRGSTELGIGRAYSSNGDCVHVVAWYKPAGNIIGSESSNVERGTMDAEYCGRKFMALNKPENAAQSSVQGQSTGTNKEHSNQNTDRDSQASQSESADADNQQNTKESNQQELSSGNNQQPINSPSNTPGQLAAIKDRNKRIKTPFLPGYSQKSELDNNNRRYRGLRTE